jgi:hypothetical protein
LEIRLVERMPRKTRTYRWVLERTKLDPKTGATTFKLKDTVLEPKDNDFRSNFDGELELSGELLSGWYRFDFNNGKESSGREKIELRLMPARSDDQAAFWPVGTKVEGKRDKATLLGVVTVSNEDRIEIELLESWDRARPTYRWIFERTGCDPKTGTCTYTVKGAVRMSAGKDPRHSYRGTVTIDGPLMSGTYAFDAGNTKADDQVWELRPIK